MKILLTTIGSRGDVQPILALAVELQALGHDPLVCAAPNFQAWVQSYGIGFTPIGPDLEQWTRSRAGASQPQPMPTPEQLRDLARYSVINSFQVLTEAAQGCDLLIVAGMAQNAGQSVAEALNIPYRFVAYSPNALPSPDHPPAKMGMVYPQSLSAEENLALWTQEEQYYNGMFLDTINEQRAALGLEPIDNVLRNIASDHPWLAADRVLAPAPAPVEMQIEQSGAWFLTNPSPLPQDLVSFLADGEAPVYFGFGSMRAADSTARILIEAARALGRRVVISQGWGQLDVIDSGNDCIAIGDVNHEKLFPHVAAIVHHGGAGTTTAAARAGTAQVIAPHVYDQFYHAKRVRESGIGVSNFTAAELSVDGLVEALREALEPETTARAQAVAAQIEGQGARIAAEQIIAQFS